MHLIKHCRINYNVRSPITVSDTLSKFQLIIMFPRPNQSMDKRHHGATLSATSFTAKSDNIIGIFKLIIFISSFILYVPNIIQTIYCNFIFMKKQTLFSNLFFYMYLESLSICNSQFFHEHFTPIRIYFV